MDSQLKNLAMPDTPMSSKFESISLRGPVTPPHLTTNMSLAMGMFTPPPTPKSSRQDFPTQEYQNTMTMAPQQDGALIFNGTLTRGELLGEGAWCKVYEAESKNHERALAIKVPSGKMALPVLTNEAKILSHLMYQTDSGQHIIPFYGQDEETSTLVFKKAECTLEQHTRRAVAPTNKSDPIIGLKAWLELAASLISSLHWLHKNDIIHGDIKPANILYTGSRFVYADFSSSFRWSGSASQEARPTDAITTYYASPELLKAYSISRPLDSELPKHPTQSSDIWALACTLLFAATSAEPYAFAGQNMRRLAMCKDGQVLAGYGMADDLSILSKIKHGGIVEKVVRPALVKLVEKRTTTEEWLQIIKDIAKENGIEL